MHLTYVELANTWISPSPAAVVVEETPVTSKRMVDDSTVGKIIGVPLPASYWI